MQIIGVTLTGVGGSLQRGGIELTNSGTMAYFEDVVFRQNRNTGTNYAGAMNVQVNARVTAVNTRFIANTAYQAGAVSLNNGAVLTTDTAVFLNNIATSFGGALMMRLSSTFIVSGSSAFVNNTGSNFGGALYINSGTVSIGSNASFSNNKALGTFDGGAIWIDGANVSLSSNATFSSNYAAGDGGALYCLGTTASTVTIGPGVTFTDNLAGSDGGAVYLSGANRISFGTGARFLKNRATVNGGGLYVYQNSIATFDEYVCI